MPQGDYLPEGMLIGTERNKEHTRGSKNILKAMAKKTVLKKVLKYAPLKSDFVRGVAADGETVRAHFDGEDAPVVEVAYEASGEEYAVDEDGVVQE